MDTCRPSGTSDAITEEMLERPLYLKPSVKIEPLICGWLVWPHLLAPVQSALNMSFRYLPLLRSFVSNHQVHLAATRDPTLFGGPFVHLSSKDVPAVKDLIGRIVRIYGRLLELANDLKAFDILVQDSCVGFCMNDLYSKAPKSLAGLIELMYDVNNKPRIHFLEDLVAAEYGEILRGESQEIRVSNITESDRRFFLSTPRLRSPDALTISSGFANPKLDMLTSMKVSALPLKQIETDLGISNLASNYSSLFTADAPQRHAPNYHDDAVRVRYFGHACVLIQTSKISILIDPIFAYETGTPDVSNACGRYTILDLPDTIDFVVISHCHQDHFSAEMLLSIRSRIRRVIVPGNNRGSIVDPSMRLILNELGIYDIAVMGHFDAIVFDEGRIVSIPFPGEHADLDIYSKQSIFLEIKNRRLLFLVDSDGQDAMLYRRIARQVLPDGDRIDALFLGMECHGAPLTWLYGPLLGKTISRRDDESRRLSGSDCGRAIGIVGEFTCKSVYVYAMGQEPWLKYMMGLEYGSDSVQLVESQKLVNHCRSSGMTSTRLFGSQDIYL
jgi:L-ascorbate metabolism protein UlaG (beta-lactamase superfamily)